MMQMIMTMQMIIRCLSAGTRPPEGGIGLQENKLKKEVRQNILVACKRQTASETFSLRCHDIVC